MHGEIGCGVIDHVEPVSAGRRRVCRVVVRGPVVILRVVVSAVADVDIILKGYQPCNVCVYRVLP